MLKNVKNEENKGNLQFCWRCGRIIYEDPRGHIGCLNSKCGGYLWGAKRYSKEQLKQVRK